MLILKQNAANTVPTPPAGKGTIFLDDSDTLSVKTSDGNVETFPTVAASNSQVVFMNGTALSGEAALTYDFNTNLLTVQGNVAAGNILTDNLLYANGNPWDLQQTAGSNTQLQFNDDGDFGASANLTFNKNTNVLTVTGNIIGSNIYANSGTIGASLLTGTLTTAAQPNITSVGTLTSVSVTGSVTAGNVYANSGIVKATSLEGTLTTAAQPNITSVGTLSSLTVSGNANVGNVGGNNAIFTTVSGTLSTAAQPNVTSLGTLSGLDVNGNIVASNITANSGVFTGNGAGLTNLAGANVTGTVANATHASTANTVTTAAQPNITSVGTLTSLAVTGNVSAGNVTGANLVSANFVTGTLTTAAQPNITSVGTLTGLTVDGSNITLANGVFAGNGSGLTSLAGANVTGTVANATHATTANTVTTAAQPNITSVGTLTSLAVTGNASAGNISTGGTLSVTGNANVGNIGAAAGVFTTVAGSLTTAAQPNITSVGTLTSLAVTGNVSAGNISTAGVFTGNGSGLSAIAGANVTGQVGFAAVANSVAGANVSGEVGFAAVANSVAGGNVSGQVANALVAGTVYTAAQPNITSVGTLTSLAVTGNASAGNISTGGVLSVTGNANVGNIGATNGVFTSVSGNGSALSSLTGANVTGQVGNALVSGTVYTNAQPNITSVGTLTGLTLGGNLAMGNFNITGLAEPVNSTDAATKSYVDSVAEGLHTHDSCNAATTGTLATISGGTVTYNNGTSGVGATLTTTGTYTTIDGVTLSDGMRILVKNEANAAHNGIYTRTSSTVLTRATDFDTPAEMAGGDFTFVNGGTLYDNTGWVMPDPVTTVGTSAVVWVQFSGAGTYTAGTGLTLTGSQFSVNASQTQITSVGTLSGLNVNGTVTASAFTANTGVFTGNGSGLSAIAGANVTGTVSSATTAGTVTTAAQPNITSVGTLTSLSVSGNANVGNIGAAAGVFTSVSGNGSALTALNASNISTGTLAQARLANASVTLGSTALTLGSTVTTVAGLTSVTSTSFVGALTGAATTAGTVTTAAQPNITSVGTLTSLAVTGNVSAGNVTSTGTLGGSGATLLGNLLTTGSNSTAGVITGDWTLSSGSTLNATYADLAEKYVADADYEPGTVLVFGGEHEVTKSVLADDHRVAGVVTTNPAYVMNQACAGAHVATIALQGRTPCKVVGAVVKGDLLVAAANGFAQANNQARAGTIIGKALSDFHGTDVDEFGISGYGIVEIAVGRF
jgi:hypothetical protein